MTFLHRNMFTFQARAHAPFRMDEIALLDLPAIFHTILSYTPPESKIIFIGHSLGTSISLMYSAEYPKYSSSILKMLVFLCPAYTLTNMISPLKTMAPAGDIILVSSINSTYFNKVLYSQLVNIH